MDASYYVYYVFRNSLPGKQKGSQRFSNFQLLQTNIPSSLYSFLFLLHSYNLQVLSTATHKISVNGLQSQALFKKLEGRATKGETNLASVGTSCAK